MEYIKGPTPNGGAYAHIYYLDANKNSCDRENATHGRILEFDEKGKRICEFHFKINVNSSLLNKKNKEIEILNID